MAVTVEREVMYYAEEDGTEPVKEWINKLKKKNKLVEASKVSTRINRAKNGNYGDHRFLGGNFFELKIDYGPGYRVYIGEDGDKLLLLLNGGTKDTQQDDIKEAERRWELYKKEKENIESENGGEK